MDSSVSPTHGEQEMSVWNGHYACTCYHPLFVFNQFGDLERCDLTENPGREILMITVEHAPGGSSAIHRHNAHAIVYVLEGSVVMQLKGGQQVTLTPGQTFYESLRAR
jgi:mannose-6-phosphate isomerase-like protein (cupin superfamily)